MRRKGELGKAFLCSCGLCAMTVMTVIITVVTSVWSHYDSKGPGLQCVGAPQAGGRKCGPLSILTCT